MSKRGQNIKEVQRVLKGLKEEKVCRVEMSLRVFGVEKGLRGLGVVKGVMGS